MDEERIGQLAELILSATTDVFTKMLEIELSARSRYVNPAPLGQGDVTAFLGLAGDQQGFVAIHCSRVQAQDFTAQLLGTTREEVADDESILDAVGELINMIGGNVKSLYESRGALQISLPTVVMTPKSQIRVKNGCSVSLELDSSLGSFQVELMLTEPSS